MKNIIIKKSKRKTVSFCVKSSDQLLVKAPWFLPDLMIKKIINNNQTKIDQLIENVKLQEKNKIAFKEGGSIPYVGTTLLIQFHSEKKVIVSGDILYVPIGIKKIHKVIVDFYKLKTKQIVSEHILFLSDKIKCYPDNIKITFSNKRWGSCNSRNNICFSWRLCMLPPEVSFYIVCHELAHLVHLNHSRLFWEEVNFYCNDYKKQIVYLKNNFYRYQI